MLHQTTGDDAVFPGDDDIDYGKVTHRVTFKFPKLSALPWFASNHLIKCMDSVTDDQIANDAQTTTIVKNTHEWYGVI